MTFEIKNVFQNFRNKIDDTSEESLKELVFHQKKARKLNRTIFLLEFLIVSLIAVLSALFF